MSTHLLKSKLDSTDFTSSSGFHTSRNFIIAQSSQTEKSHVDHSVDLSKITALHDKWRSQSLIVLKSAISDIETNFDQFEQAQHKELHDAMDPDQILRLALASVEKALEQRAWHYSLVDVDEALREASLVFRRVMSFYSSRERGYCKEVCALSLMWKYLVTAVDTVMQAQTTSLKHMEEKIQEKSQNQIA